MHDDRSRAPKPVSQPSRLLPRGACDTHTHVFGPEDRFPFRLVSGYVPPVAPYETHRAMLDAIGAQRGVLVQPTVYGADSSALVDALRRSKGSLRGVVTATANVSDPELERLHAAGVRALRFAEVADPQTGGRYRGTVGFSTLLQLAPRLRALGWHAELWADCDRIAADADALAALGIPIVVDHMGRFEARRGVADPSFQRLLRLLAAGTIWVKLAVCRVSSDSPRYADVRSFHDALLSANVERLVWGSDWPHVRMGDQAPDAGHLVDLFHVWVEEAAARQRILVENPQQLYGFAAYGDIS